MAKALRLALGAFLVGVAVLANAQEKKRAVVGCAASAKACTCYSKSGRTVEVEKDVCEAKFTPTTFTRFEQGDITALETPVRIKPPVPENYPFHKVPVPWLIER